MSTSSDDLASFIEVQLHEEDDSEAHNSITRELHIETLCPPHPGDMGGMCIRCGQIVDSESDVKLSYVHKTMRLSKDEIARQRNKGLKKLMSNKKLILVLDLDHTLLNSTRFVDITPEERYLTAPKETLPDAIRDGLFHLDSIPIMMTKLRPYADAFLREASGLFEMYICTMGERAYAGQVANILDPRNVYFNSKVWSKHKENLILMQRYHFFQSSCKQFGFKCKSLSERKKDECKDDGALATILKILQRVHTLYFDQKNSNDLLNRDVRKVLKNVRKEVLQGCKIVFSRIFPTKFPGKNHHLWRMAEQLGATCSTELDDSVTHVVSTDIGTGKSCWAVSQNKFLVHPEWIEACNYFWRKEPEEKFPVNQEKISDPPSTQE